MNVKAISISIFSKGMLMTLAENSLTQGMQIDVTDYFINANITFFSMNQKLTSQIHSKFFY
jgi:hypothetical protein